MKKESTSDLLIGISTAAYHIEGNLIHSDWWEFEKTFFAGKPELLSGDTVDYWNRWREDHEYLSELGANVYRTSIDWSRIQPEQGVFDEEAIAKYKEQFEDLNRRGIKIVLTLFHYVSPKWFAELGAFTNKENLIFFQTFADRILEEFKDYIYILTPLNEIMVYCALTYLSGNFPPQQKSLKMFLRVTRNLLRAHFLAAEIVEERGYSFKVSTAEHYRHFNFLNKPIIKGTLGRFSNYFVNKAITYSIKNNVFAFPFGLKSKITRKKHKSLDYVGMQIYPRIDLKLSKIDKILSVYPESFPTFAEAIYGSKFTPEDLLAALQDFHKTFHTEILITEAGIDTKDDTHREKVLEDTFEVIQKAVESGIPLKGYIHFTLFDCFEWLQSFIPTFGIIAVDRSTQTRIKKPSFEKFKKLISETKSKSAG